MSNASALNNVIMGELTVEDIPIASDEPAPAETAAAEAPEAGAPAETDEAPAPEQPTTPADIEPLSDEMLAKLDPAVRDAVNKRLDMAREAKRKHDRAFLKLKHREDKFSTRAEAFRREQAAFNGQVDLIRANLNVLRSGDGKAVLQAIQQLTGRDAHSIVEEMNLTLVGKKKPDDATLELRRELAELKKEREDEKKRLQTEREQADYQRQIAQGKQRLLNHASRATTQGGQVAYPLLSAYAAENGEEVSEALANLVIQAYDSGSPMTDHQACLVLEQHLTKLSRVRAPANQPEVGTGTANGSRSQGTPALRAPAQSLTSQHVSGGSAQREMSDRERYAELADDPDVDRLLGGFLNQ